MKKLLALVAALCMLTACGGGSSEKTTVCSGTTSGGDVVNTIKYVDEKVNSITYQNTMEIDESLIDYVKEYADSYKETVEQISGISYTYTIDGTTVVETTTIDYTVADMDELISNGMIDAGENETVDYIDYELTLDNMTSIGLTCTEQ